MATTTTKLGSSGLGGVAAKFAQQTKCAINSSNKVSNSVFPPSAAKGLPSQRYKKLLLVCKESRLTRWEKKGILMNPFVEKNYK